MKTPITIGVIGYGYWGPNLARNFNLLPSAKLTAVCDLVPARLERMHILHPDVNGFTDFEKMLRETHLDAIVIATPLRTHHAIAKACLLAGKHVLIEKPMAASTQECEELIQLADESGVTLMVGHTYLFSEPVKKIVDIISSGDIGELRYINCQRLNLGIFKRDINVVWDLAPHDISIILHVMGSSPKIINCQGNAHINPDIEDVTNLSLTFEGKRFATVQSSWLEPRKVRQMTFVGTHKMIVYDDLQALEKIRIFDVRVECPPHYDNFAEFHYSYHYGDCYIPRIEQSEPLQKMCSHFVNCIESRTIPVTCGRKGLDVVRILEASTESLKSHGVPVILENKTSSKPISILKPSNSGLSF